MRKLSIGIIDLVAKAPPRTTWMRVMGANFVSIMPQVVATWCEEQGYDVTLVETGIVVGSTSLLNAALVGIAFEVGVGIGFAINVVIEDLERNAAETDDPCK